MAKVFIEDSTLTAIGDAIRNKKGTTALIDPANFADEIEAIETGGGSDETLKALIDGSITKIDIPEGTSSITPYAFYNLKNLTKVVIPTSVTIIDSFAFAFCSALTVITIPASVTDIASNALKIGSSSSKATITMLSETPPTISSNTIDTTKLKKIRIPASASIAYANANIWSTLRDYFETY